MSKIHFKHLLPAETLQSGQKHWTDIQIVTNTLLAIPLMPLICLKKKLDKEICCDVLMLLIILLCSTCCKCLTHLLILAYFFMQFLYIKLRRAYS